MSAYKIHLDDKYCHSNLIDIPAEIAAVEDEWCYTVPRNVVHRTRAPHRTAIVMVESAGVTATGD